jgi:hypothetical protein
MHLASLSALVSEDGRVIGDWSSWLQAVAVHAEPQRLLETARNQQTRWEVATLLTDPEAPSLLLDIATSDPDRALVLRQARPLFMSTLLEELDLDSEVRTEATPLLAALAEVIASEERIGQHELTAVLELAERVLSATTTESEYVSVVQDGLRQVWARASNARELGWLADAVRLVARGTANYAEPRRAFLELAAASVGAHPRLYEEDRQALVEAFSFAEIDPSFVPARAPGGDEDDAEAWAPLRRRKTLIYTLVDAAGRRAREFIKAQVADADVVVLNQLDADRRLIEHARRADLLVVATRAATHAATGAIERHRRPDAIVIYPTGKGWSSIVGSLRETLRDLR